jgi:hypothetical protein
LAKGIKSSRYCFGSVEPWSWKQNGI